jgi:uncharacterized protein with von Willebrand factor type A (vWA) domain
MKAYRYSKWDGTQHIFEFDSDELMDELADDLMHNVDLPYILWKLQRQSTAVNNLRLSKLEEVLAQLRHSKQQQLSGLSLVMGSIEKELDDILKMEMARVREVLEAEKKGLKLDLTNKGNISSNNKDVASKNLKKLKQLPADISGKIKELQKYDFVSNEARRRFQELMVASLNVFSPDDKLTAYPLFSEDSISFTEALKLIEMLQEMDKLEGQIKDARFSGNMDAVDEQTVRSLLGEQTARELKSNLDITQVLEEANYIRRIEDGFELTPLGMRKIAQKALLDVITQPQKDKNGRNKIYEKSNSGNRSEETKLYEFGDDFDLELNRTIMNSLLRQQQTPPVKLEVDDFEIYKPEQIPRSAIVLMIDLSLSMSVRNNFNAAKQVALALDGLIRSQFPRDTFHIVGFSSFAREIKKKELTTLRLDQTDPYTNIQHGLELARKLLVKEQSRKKQIIIVTDGEPTAHKEEGQTYVNYSPGARTLQMTLREVEYCSRSGITINTFMLGDNSLPNAFITKIAQINTGRVFFTSPDNLGKYVLVDYLSNRRKTLS